MPKKSITLYKYVPLQYAVDILDNHRLYLSDGLNFNDPFEITVTEPFIQLTFNATYCIKGIFKYLYKFGGE